MTRLRLVSYLAPGFPAALFELLAERLDAELTLIETTSGPPLGEDPFAHKTFDIVWICSTSFVDLALRAAKPSVVLPAAGRFGGWRCGRLKVRDPTVGAAG